VSIVASLLSLQQVNKARSQLAQLDNYTVQEGADILTALGSKLRENHAAGSHSEQWTEADHGDWQ
jgi:hypothetical protein